MHIRIKLALFFSDYECVAMVHCVWNMGHTHIQTALVYLSALEHTFVSCLR